MLLPGECISVQPGPITTLRDSYLQGGAEHTKRKPMPVTTTVKRTCTVYKGKKARRYRVLVIEVQEDADPMVLDAAATDAPATAAFCAKAVAPVETVQAATDVDLCGAALKRCLRFIERGVKAPGGKADV